jgi:Family of unknown function (DUF6152)
MAAHAIDMPTIGRGTMKILRAGCAFAILLLFASAAFAHHSGAMFDRDKTVELTGTVATFSWTNPHSWIEIDVPNSNGGTDRWGVECNSPNNMARQGWRSSTLKPGDQVTISVHPLRSGEKGGRFLSVKFPDGRVLTDFGYQDQNKP